LHTGTDAAVAFAITSSRRQPRFDCSSRTALFGSTPARYSLHAPLPGFCAPYEKSTADSVLLPESIRCIAAGVNHISIEKPPVAPPNNAPPVGLASGL